VTGLVLLLLSMLPHAVAVDRVDVLELNNVYCQETGEDRLAQWIYWDHRTEWFASGKQTDLFVIAWRLSKDAPTPRRDGELWVQEWFDKKDGIFRRVESRDFWRRDLPYDIELRDRDRIPENRRCGFTKGTK
jgi:hypothetical protein